MTATELSLARRRARRLYPRSKGYENTYVRGAYAALGGRPAAACPYPTDPYKTWLAVWRRAWMRGYESVIPPGER